MACVKREGLTSPHSPREGRQPRHHVARAADAKQNTHHDAMVVEFQAVVLASVSDGDGLYPLTEELPQALLPVANRPLISFQLELLERSQSFSQVLVLTTR